MTPAHTCRRSRRPKASHRFLPGDRFSVVFSPASVGAFGPPSRRLSGSGRGGRLPDARANTDRPCKPRSHRFSSPGCRPQVKAPPGRVGMGLPSGQGGRSFPRAFPAAAGLYRPRREQVAKPAQSPRLPHVPPPATGFPAFFLRLSGGLLTPRPAAFPAAAARRAVAPLRLSAQKSGARQKRDESRGHSILPGRASPRPSAAAEKAPTTRRRRGRILPCPRAATRPTGFAPDGNRRRPLPRGAAPGASAPLFSAAPGRAANASARPFPAAGAGAPGGAQSRPPFSSIVRV